MMSAKLPQNIHDRALLTEHGIDRQFLSMLTDQQAQDLLKGILYLKEKHKHLLQSCTDLSCN
ncbi:hypothetical protein NTE_00404 [Candidatus Nitrososphaera evergladensis SR1]|uniref:Uncharacterized protein n=1 Tax=Candidatus Nitrososphaera evergladensis SR1 TaxID=1459636 RepID=A0A075MLV6_9ARCH|nr:hypothetical protein NTE_00404 [Candidatus Nitrososphaera evergladensis SR1]